jgi:hypothetical protein
VTRYESRNYPIMGNYRSKFAAADPHLESNQNLDDFTSIRSNGSHDVEDPYSLNHAQAPSSNISYFCPICSDVLADTTEYGATKYHSSLVSLEDSVKSGCHLCSLVRHFLPERPRHQLDEYLTLSLIWDGSWEGLLFAGWRHLAVSFNLVQSGRLTKFRK